MRASFEKSLDEAWCDWTCRRIYADWLDDHEEPDPATIAAILSRPSKPIPARRYADMTNPSADVEDPEGRSRWNSQRPYLWLLLRAP
jgi:uncharacterized protein (TIGR02996 family)